MTVPPDLRERLIAFVPAPKAAHLSCLEQIPSSKPQPGDLRSSDLPKSDPRLPLVQRFTEQAAFQDLRTILRLIDQEKVSVSPTILLPSKTTMALLNELLRDHDFFACEQGKSWDTEVGPIKAFSWPLLVQAAKLAAVRNSKLALTKRGRTALDSPPAQTLREIWNAWIDSTVIDEFSRVDTIRGQKGKGGRDFTRPADRRRVINIALKQCPAGKWVEVGEFSRYMRAAGLRFEVSNNRWNLYICDPQYGSLGYEGYGGWNILQERYLFCLLFEYAAPLGLIDLAYEHPAGARGDFHNQWGTDDLSFLSRYDGLRYFRLTPLGAFVLGLTPAYELQEQKPGFSLTVLPNKKIRVHQGELSPDQILLLENFADQETGGLWSLNEAKALEAVEEGAGVAEFRAFLGAGDPQPLPETVEGFLAAVQQRGAACICKGSALLIESKSL